MTPLPSHLIGHAHGTCRAIPLPNPLPSSSSLGQRFRDPKQRNQNRVMSLLLPLYPYYLSNSSLYCTHRARVPRIFSCHYFFPSSFFGSPEPEYWARRRLSFHNRNPLSPPSITILNYPITTSIRYFSLWSLIWLLRVCFWGEAGLINKWEVKSRGGFKGAVA